MLLFKFFSFFSSVCCYVVEHSANVCAEVECAHNDALSGLDHSPKKKQVWDFKIQRLVLARKT